MGAKMSKARGFAPRPYQRQSLWNPFIKWFPKASGLWRVQGRALAYATAFRFASATGASASKSFV